MRSHPILLGYEPPYRPSGGRVFEAYIHWNGLVFLAFGVSLWLGGPNLELHFPGGFLRIGWRVDRPQANGVFVVGKAA